MMTKISIYNLAQFKINGQKKKNAKPKNFWQLGYENWHNLVVDDMKRAGYHNFTSPYIFTHIKAINKDGQEVRIYQDVKVADSWLMTSPTKLLAELIKN